jgi:NADH-quinone oxidoreductase subunit N
MFSDVTSFAALAPAYPEIVLALGAIILLLAGVLFRRSEHGIALSAVAATFLVALAFVVAFRPAEGVLFNGGFIADDFARFMKFLILGGSGIALLLSFSTARQDGLDKFEYGVLIMLSALGAMVMVSAYDLITLYVGLELHSLALYVVAAMDRDNARASEAGLKYFVLGALSSGMLLYGASLVYGFTGQTELGEIARVLAQGAPSIGLIFGLVFLIAGLAFKISAVPFHMWTPDVYEGAPTPVTAFFATAPKVAAMALLVRVVVQTFPSITHEWQQIIIFLSIASMVLAAFAAIGQRSFKRLIAYSSIGHVGFALVGLSAGNEVGVEGVAIYLAIYILMTLGVFACMLAIRDDAGVPIDDMNEFGGYAQKRPFVAGSLAVLLFSFIGLPPLAGFFAKWHVFLAAMEANLYVLAVIGVLASAVSAFYYLRIIKTMYFDEPVREFAGVPGELTAVMGVSGFLVVTYFALVGSPLAAIAKAAAESLF